MAKRQHIPLSAIPRDPAVAAFLARGERDNGNQFAVPVYPKPSLIGGEVVLA
ncbi:MAG TPA: hypothetical protein VIL30_14525 [Ramlibacter sp.]|jgi:hypothetical protein